MLNFTGTGDLFRFEAKLFGCDLTFICSYKNIELVKKNARLNDEFRTIAKPNTFFKAKIDSISFDNV